MLRTVGLFRFDPTAVRHMDLTELQLCPEGATVGTEIRIVGNDAAEKLSIASGTLARVDRAAPNYGKGSFNDFNTFYLQASSSTTVSRHDSDRSCENPGGLSGGVCVGWLVGLACDQRGGAGDRSQRGGEDGHGRGLYVDDAFSICDRAPRPANRQSIAASDYLPLQRVRRAVELLRAGKPVSRGWLGCVLAHKPLSEARRLGLREQTEEEVWAAQVRATPSCRLLWVSEACWHVGCRSAKAGRGRWRRACLWCRRSSRAHAPRATSSRATS